MNERGKSDGSVVPQKLPNEAQAEEAVEERGPAKGNLRPQDTSQAQHWSNDVQSKRERIRKAAAEDKRLRFTTLFHHVYDPEALREAYFGLKRKAAPGVDGETWQTYGEDLEANLQDLSARLKRGGYRAKPVRRVFIAKADGRQRPLGVTALEDKVVQGAFVAVLNAIYETDFLGFSYGFRPRRHQHQALDALTVGLKRRKVNWVLDADIRGFLEPSSHYTPSVGCGSKSVGACSNTLILKPLRRPRRTWRAWRSPRFTRCNTA
jgi:RNA-directed DNA polymerase